MWVNALMTAPNTAHGHTLPDKREQDQQPTTLVVNVLPCALDCEL